jgi:hypothetical protein
VKNPLQSSTTNTWPIGNPSVELVTITIGRPHWSTARRLLIFKERAGAWLAAADRAADAFAGRRQASQRSPVDQGCPCRVILDDGFGVATYLLVQVLRELVAGLVQGPCHRTVFKQTCWSDFQRDTICFAVLTTVRSIGDG